jgi:hypothetical protein
MLCLVRAPPALYSRGGERGGRGRKEGRKAGRQEAMPLPASDGEEGAVTGGEEQAGRGEPRRGVQNYCGSEGGIFMLDFFSPGSD